jgi:hypothetical protein
MEQTRNTRRTTVTVALICQTSVSGYEFYDDSYQIAVSRIEYLRDKVPNQLISWTVAGISVIKSGLTQTYAEHLC